MRLLICDNGPGIAEGVATTGMGSKLIKAFAKQLHASYEIRTDGGTVFDMRIPL